MSRQPNGGFIGKENITDNTQASGVYNLAEVGQKIALNEYPPARYTPSRSLRFDSARSTYLQRTPAGAGNRSTWTYSFWVKRSKVNNTDRIIGMGGTGNQGYIGFVDDAIYAIDFNGSTTFWNLVSTPLYRDPSAWYHVIIALNTTDTVGNNRVKIYVNGYEVTAFQSRTNPTQNYQGYYNDGNIQYIGRRGFDTNNLFNGYLAEVNFIDGQALTPSAFGEFEPRTGEWKPKRYAGTYGTNGFYLSFANNSSTSTLGLDDGTGLPGSGAGSNDWTSVNHSLSIGANYDSFTDVPGVGAPVTNDTGGVTRGNYCTWNPLTSSNSAVNYISNGTLSHYEAAGGNVWRMLKSSISIPPGSGKWYMEMTLSNITGTFGGYLGIANPSEVFTVSAADGYGLIFNGISYYKQLGNNPSTLYNILPVNGDVIMMAYDAINGKIWWGRNGTWFEGNPSAGTGAPFDVVLKDYVMYYSLITQGSAAGLTTNFGQRAFAYSPPTGFKSLCTTNLPDPVIKRPQDYFDIKLYTGNGTGQTIGNTARKTDNYQISRSLRFNAAEATNYLTRTLGTPTSSQKFTYSTWIKRASLGSAQFILQAGNASNVETQWYFLPATDQIRFYDYDGTHRYDITTVLAFKDTSSWFHLVVQYDSTQANSADRFKVYINGVSISLTTTVAVTQNATNSRLNSAVSHDIGGSNIEARWFDGYLAEINFVDGQSLTAESFGSFDVDGSWQAKSYTGTYGNNGFRLTFSDNSNTTATTLGKDAAGSNNFTPNGFTVTAGTGNDSLVDVPSNWGDDGTDSGGEVRGSYPILGAYQNGVTVSDGGLRFVCSNDTTPRDTFATVKLNSGKWYWEVFKNNNCIRFFTGIIEDTGTPGNGYTAKVGYDTVNASNRTLMYAVDFTLGKYWSGKEGVWDSGNPALGTGGTVFVPSTGTGYWIPLAGGYAETPSPSADGFINFGQRPFAYTPPAGFKSINTKNLNEQYPFVGGPDLVWIKVRNQSFGHLLFDTLRGPNNVIRSNETTAEAGFSTYGQTLTQFNSNGFTLGNDAIIPGGVNGSNNNYVAWCWNAGNRTIGNQDGTLNANVRVNKEAGFSIVSYIGNATAGATVGHGLGVAPAMIITKTRKTASDWAVYHRSIGPTAFLRFNTTAAAQTASTVWNDRAPSSSVFTVGTASAVNDSGNMIAYCFAEVPGYSKFGSYVGNGSTDGPFIYTGFKPRYIMWKRTDTTQVWVIVDTARDTYNITHFGLSGESNLAEYNTTSSSSWPYLDILSNGFKHRGTDVAQNSNGGNYVYMAFAESPFKYALAR